MALALAVVTGTACYGDCASAADWKPDKPIELIVGTGPGSGVDNTARTLQAIVQTYKLIEVPLTITNKPGGSYGVALNYLGQFPGDAHRIFIQTSTPLSALLTGQLNIKYFEFTPIANLISEPIAFMVRAESPLTGGRDLAQRLKTDPASVSIAVAAARGNAFHIASALLAKAMGADIRKFTNCCLQFLGRCNGRAARRPCRCACGNAGRVPAAARSTQDQNRRRSVAPTLKWTARRRPHFQRAGS